MRVPCCLVVALVLHVVALGGLASAQQEGAWLGAEVVDVAKAEADKLGWDAPRGAKVKRIEAGSPVDKAGLKIGDIILSVDRTEVDSAADFSANIESRRGAVELRVRALAGDRELRVAVVLAESPTHHAASRDTTILQLDTGGHNSLIRALVFAPDGRHLVSAGDDKVIRVWDLQTGKTVRSIRGQVVLGDEGKIYTIALSPDSKLLAVGVRSSSDSAASSPIRLYDFAEGRLSSVLYGHTSVVVALAFSPDGKRLISGSYDQSAILWDVEGRTQVAHLTGHGGPISGVGFSQDGLRAVTGSHDKTLKLWSVADGRQIATLSGHKDRVWSLAISNADGSIASASWDGEIRLWDGRTGNFLRTLGRQSGMIGALNFSADGAMLLSPCGHGSCNFEQKLWDVATGNVLLSYRGNDNSVAAAAMSHMGRLVATGGGNKRQIDIWNADTGELQRRFVGQGAIDQAVGFSTDGRHLAWGHDWLAGHSSVPQPLAWQLRLPQSGSPLGMPARLGSTGAVTVVQARRAHHAYTLRHRKGGRFGHDSAALDVRKNGWVQASIIRGVTGYRHNAYTFTPDGQSIISGGDHGDLIAYDLQGKELGRFVGHESDIWAVTPSPDGRLLVSGNSGPSRRSDGNDREQTHHPTPAHGQPPDERFLHRSLRAGVASLPCEPRDPARCH